MSFRISDKIIRYVKKHLKKGDTILELGTGAGSLELYDKGFELIGIEEDPYYVARHPGVIIEAPIKHNWYSVKEIRKHLDHHYDGIIVDGPRRLLKNSRERLADNLGLFDWSGLVVITDTHLPVEGELSKAIQEHCKRDAKTYKDGKGTFDLIEPLVKEEQHESEAEKDDV